MHLFNDRTPLAGDSAVNLGAAIAIKVEQRVFVVIAPIEIAGSGNDLVAICFCLRQYFARWRDDARVGAVLSGAGRAKPSTPSSTPPLATPTTNVPF